MDALKLIFMGTPEFALPSLKHIVEAGHHVVAVYTQPPRPAGRGQKETLSPVHQYALSKGLDVFTPVTLKTPEAAEQFAAHKADASVVAAYGLILPRAILEATPMGCINVHPSLLPRWRGAAPIQRTIMAGDRETGIVIMQMDVGLDTGDMLLIKRFPIPEGMTSGELHDALAQLAGPMVVETLAGLKQGRITRIPQPAEGLTYAQKIIKEDAVIDWNRSAHDIRQQILGLNPYPCASLRYKNEAIKILNADIVSGTSSAIPATVIDNRLTIACGQDALRPTLIQRPGKKPMPAGEMLRGYPIPAGTVMDA